MLTLSSCGSTDRFPVSTSTKCDNERPVKLIGKNYIHLCGGVSEKNYLEFERLIEVHEIRGVAVDLLGGETAAGIKMGLLIHQRELPVYVNNLCFSACAQWIVMAAPEVYFRSTSVFAIHHTQNSLNLIRQSDAKPHLAELAKSEETFYNKLGVPHRFLFDGMLALNPRCIVRDSAQDPMNVSVSLRVKYAFWMPDEAYFRSVYPGELKTDYPVRGEGNWRTRRIVEKMEVDVVNDVDLSLEHLENLPVCQS